MVVGQGSTFFVPGLPAEDQERAYNEPALAGGYAPRSVISRHRNTTHRNYAFAYRRVAAKPAMCLSASSSMSKTVWFAVPVTGNPTLDNREDSSGSMMKGSSEWQ